MDWQGRDPRLGDVTLESGTSRWYLLVGIEEHRDSPRVWWLTLERISAREALDRLAATPTTEDGLHEGYWPHTRYRRANPAPRPQ